ncbi:MAG TPA: NAD(P)/FAD-dependent oxidoreductase [Parafilimonas sp.]|nr:NAD(P)/FAD-dependent oxidoreductase [Parafilimonas sp.]
MLSSGVKHIVVIGGGFAGLNFIKALANNKHYTITLVDKNNYNQFTPLVYQVATGFLEPSNISYPFRKFLRRRNNIRFHLGELKSISAKEHLVYLNNATLHYDYLVLAIGSVSNYFGNDVLKQNTIAMKTLTDALSMRNVLLQSLEEACNTNDDAQRKKLLTIVVAGGGPTGVEVSGMLGEMRKFIIQKDYPELKNAMGDIYIVDGAKTLLSQMGEQSQRDAMHTLEKLGVKIITNTFINSYDNDEVKLSNGNSIQTKNLIWAAGVTGNVIAGIPATAYGRGKRIIVDEYNHVAELDDVFAIGDNCLLTTDKKFPNGHPQLAQPAIQQGKHLAKNFIALAKEKAMEPFIYYDKGVMAIIGKNKAVVDLTKPKMHVKGFAALLIWLFIHIVSLIAFDNKLKTLYNWVIAYFTKDQSLRMVIKTDDETASK